MYKFPFLNKSVTKYSASSNSEMDYCKYTLRFAEPLERNFLVHYFSTSIRSYRVSLFLATIFYALFAFLDYIIFPELQSDFLIIRLGVICPVALSILAFSYSKVFAKYWQLVMSFTLVLAGTGIIIMVGMAPSPLDITYYAGLYLVLIYNYNLSKLRFIWASVAAWMILFICVISDRLFNDISTTTFIANYFFLLSANLFGMLSSYYMELFARREFYSQHLLKNEQEKVEKNNQELEVIVNDRTDELVKINKQLNQNKMRNNKAQEIGLMGSWEYIPAKGVFWGSKQAKKILGINNLSGDLTEELVVEIFEDRNGIKELIKNAIDIDSSSKGEFNIIPKNSTKTKTIQLIAEANYYDREQGVILQGFIQDITERKEAEQRQELIVKILSILNRPNEWQKLLDDILLEMKKFIKLDAVAIRLKDKNSYPFFASYGFSEEYLDSEKCTCKKMDNGEIVCNKDGMVNSACMCGYVLSGNGSSVYPFFSKLGSFWTNRNSEIGNSASRSELFAKPRRFCLTEGYESVALIPLYSGEQIIGLLHFSGKEVDQFSIEMVHFFEELGATIGIAFKRMLSEKRIKENQARTRNLFENSPVTIWENDFSEVKNYLLHILPRDIGNVTRYLFQHKSVASKSLGLIKVTDVNISTLKMFNASSKSEFNNKIGITYTPDSRKVTLECIGKLMSGNLHVCSETVLKTLDGVEKSVVIDWQVSPGFEESLDRVIVTIIDITKRKKAQNELEKSEQSLRGLYENATIGMYRSSPNGRVLMANPSILSMLGYDSYNDLTSIDHVQQFYSAAESREQFKEIIEKEDVIHDFQSVWVKKDGTQICVRESAKAIRDNYNNIMYYEGVVEDITAGKQAEDKIKMLAHAIEGVSECVSITDKNNIIKFVNDAFMKTYGYSSDELIGENIDIIRKDCFSLKKQEIIKAGTFSGGWKGEVINLRKDGSKFPALLSTSVIRDTEDNIMALVGVAIDITEMKRSSEELIRAKENAENSEKLKTEFLAQMSHEIRTPINAILNFSSLIKSEVENKIDPELFDGFSSIDSASKRVIRTIDLILNMSEIQTGTYEYLPKNFNLKEVIEGIRYEFADLAKSKGLELNVNVQTKETELFADEYSIGQIFANLVDNAIKYTMMGKVEIELTRDDEDNLCVTVMDTGIGISQEYLPHLFEAFRQEEQGYSRRYEGNGLGLALVKKYCEFNNAWVTINSKKDKGTTVKVKFHSQV